MENLVEKAIQENQFQENLEKIEQLSQSNSNELQKVQERFLNLDKQIKQNRIKTLIVGGGCFWCIEAMMQRVDGVNKTQCGYSGGHVENPTLEEIQSQQSGHAEVIRVEYDETKIAYEDLIYIFMYAHDPTTLNKQKNDIGPKYRSIILYQNEEEKQAVERIFDIVTKEKFYKDPIVTEVKQFDRFYIALTKHWNYYELNQDAPYCQNIINPKMKKFLQKFSKFTKKNS